MSIYSIGQHRVRLGDIADETGILQLIAGEKADIFYTDPPWGNMKYWQTLTKKQTGTEVAVEITSTQDFITRILEVAAEHTVGWVVIEFGKKWSKGLIQAAASHGLHYCGTVETLYGSPKRPLDNMFFHTEGVQSVDLSSLYHLSGYGVVKKTFEVLGADGGLGMDLCCGMGYTAQASIDNNMRFIGNELNKARLAKTIARLKRGRV